MVCAASGLETTSVPVSAVLKSVSCSFNVHEVAALLVQVSLVEVFLRTRVGSADRVTVGRHRVSDGVVALQEPLQRMVPLPTIPHAFVAGTDGQALP